MSACSAYDPAMLDRRAPAQGPRADSGQAAADGGTVDAAGGSGGVGGGGGSGGGSAIDAGAEAGPLGNDCVPNPDSSNEVCTQICPEACNGEDDDCDRRVDEDEPGINALCLVANATAICEKGACLLVSCEGNFRDCNDDVSDGCEASLDDVSSCGACGVVCDIDRAIEGCIDGKCVPIGCDAGYGDCDDDPATVCETIVDTVKQCGACDIACDAPYAVSGCENLACAVASCDPGHGDCDGDATNGCEVTLDSLQDCGACGKPCGLLGCAGGVCSSEQCAAPAADCDGMNSDCEVDLSTDADHCGACAVVCALGVGATHAGGAVCTDSLCAASCDTDFGDCDLDYTTGCEVPLLTTAANCSVCGNDCSALPHVKVGSCAVGTCGITTCDSGWADCDSDPTTGCEGDGADPDGDGFPNCLETCDSDPNKQAPGICGCGVADTNTDGDAQVDCNDGCDADPTKVGLCLGYVPTNFDPNAINFSTQPVTTLGCGTTTVNTTDPDGAGPLVATLTNWCGTAPTLFVVTQIGGGNAVAIGVRGLTVSTGNTLNVIGSRPLWIAVDGNVQIAGTVSASASGAVPGAGGNLTCGTSTGGTAQGNQGSNGSGGGGGGFGTAGGNGGVAGGFAIGAGGVTRGNATLTPLVGGCPGGSGGGYTCSVGAGGGALQISASGSLTVTGVVQSNGGVGANGCGNDAGGAGGGSGGAILIEATTVTAAAATLKANGGGGGESQGGGNLGGAGSTSAAAAGARGSDGGASGAGAGGGGYGRVRTVVR
jgi:hypothetical protein